MATKILDHAFSAGELTPELYGRVDFDKFSEGLALCRNFISLPHGPVVNRTGTEFVSAVKNAAVATRLIPFSYNNVQTFAIEVGAGYFRWHTQAATIGTSLTTPWSSAASYLPNDLAYYGGVLYSCITANTNSTPPSANWRTTAWSSVYPNIIGDLVSQGGLLYYRRGERPVYSMPINTIVNNGVGLIRIETSVVFNQFYNGDHVHIAGVTGATEANGTWVITNVQLLGLFALAFDLVGSTYTNAYSSAGTVDNINVSPSTAPELWYAMPVGIYEIPNSYAAADLFNIRYVQSSDTLTLVHPNYPPQELRRYGATNWQLTQPSFNPPQNCPTSPVATKTGASTAVTYSYAITSLAPTTLEESIASAVATCANDLTVSPNLNTITWSAPSGTAPVRYKVYRLFQGIYGYIGQAAGNTFVDQNITPDTSQTPPLYDTTFASATNYPSAVTYYQQRRVFGATASQPQNLWMTKSGTESNMSYSIPTAADNRIAIRIAAREASAIVHLVPAAQLVMLTASVEWTVTSSGGAITPSTITVAPQSYNGSGPATPVVVGNLILYASARGGHIRELSYSWQAGSYISADISLLAPHLFDYNTINDMAFSRGPIPTLWAISSTGDLLGMTYVPEQKVAAWHHHDTGINDSFESICVVTENNEDMLYVVVNRTINGAQVRYVERLHTRNFPTLAQAFFVDSGMTYSGAPTTTVSGLTWLIGMTVNILADGAVSPSQIVDGTGTITLPAAASIITVGLPITAQIRTLPMASQTDSALGQGRPKSVNKAWLRVYRSSGIQAGPDLSTLTSYAQRTTEAYGSAPNLISDEVAITLTPTWGRSGQIYVQQTDPLPLDIASIALEVAMGG